MRLYEPHFFLPWHNYCNFKRKRVMRLFIFSILTVFIFSFAEYQAETKVISPRKAQTSAFKDYNKGILFRA